MAQKYVYEKSSKEPVNILKFNGIFDFDGLYKVMHDWLVDRQYYFEESLYKHKVPTPAGAEQHIKWDCWRKVNAYVKYWINIYFILRDMKEVEVIKDGERKKLTKARLLIVFGGKVELDFSKRFPHNRLAKNLMDFLINYIWKPEKVVSMWWDELYYRIYKFQRVVKEYLEMESKGNAYYDMW